MTSPDRAELGVQSTSVSENPKENGHIPRLARMQVFTTSVITRRGVLRGVAAMAGLAILSQEAEPVNAQGAPRTPTPNPLDVQIEAQKANTNAAATQAADAEKARKDQEAKVAALNQAQIDYNTAQARIAAAQGSVLPPPERTAAAKATQAADLTRRINDQSTREAGFAVTATKEAVVAATATRIAQATATERAQLTATAKVPIPVPVPVATTTKAATTSEVPLWLWGVGGVLFAGLAYKAYEGWKPSTKTASSGVVGAGPNAPSVNPNSAPSMGPAQPKNPEWIIGQKDFERRWQTVKSKLPPLQPGDTGNEPGYILDRFKAGMSVVHEVSLDDVTNAPEMNTRVRAGIEYLIPEIWPSNRIFTGFFDPGFNAGYLTPEDLAKIMYLPQSYRNLSSFTKGQKRDVMGIRRVLLHALHPDLLKSDADPKLQDQINTLLIQLNSTWPLINKLLS